VKQKGTPKALGVLAVSTILLGGGATFFQYQTVAQAKAKVAELEAEVPSQKDLEADLSATNAKLASYKQDLKHLEANVPDVAYIPTLMKELEVMGKDFNITVTGVRPAPQVGPPPKPEEGVTKKKKDYAEVEIEVKGRGTLTTYWLDA
jgi:Tfp pilus assembly protein PilO